MNEDILFEKTQLGKINDSKPARLTIEEFEDPLLFVTKLSGGAKPNYQLMYSLGDDVFLNTFSDRLSMWDIGGLHIMADCRGKTAPGEPPFMTFYKRHNIKNKKIVNMSFAGITMRGFLVALEIQDYTQKGIEGFKFQLRYISLIQNLRNGDSNTSSEKPSETSASGEYIGTPSGIQYASLGGVNGVAQPVNTGDLVAIEGLS